MPAARGARATSSAPSSTRPPGALRSASRSSTSRSAIRSTKPRRAIRWFARSRPPHAPESSSSSPRETTAPAAARVRLPTAASPLPATLLRRSPSAPSTRVTPLREEMTRWRRTARAGRHGTTGSQSLTSSRPATTSCRMRRLAARCTRSIPRCGCRRAISD